MHSGHFRILSPSSNMKAQFVAKERTAILFYKLSFNHFRRKEKIVEGKKLLNLELLSFLYIGQWGQWNPKQWDKANVNKAKGLHLHGKENV